MIVSCDNGALTGLFHLFDSIYFLSANDEMFLPLRFCAETPS